MLNSPDSFIESGSLFVGYKVNKNGFEIEASNTPFPREKESFQSERTTLVMKEHCLIGVNYHSTPTPATNQAVNGSITDLGRTPGKTTPRTDDDSRGSANDRPQNRQPVIWSRRE